MKRTKLTSLVLSSLGAVGAIAWFIVAPGWESAVTVLLASGGVVAMIKVKRKKESGIGGSAIRTEGEVSLSIANRGLIQAGKGGSGAAGGDAILINPGPGVTVKIINEGDIVGGDAGQE